MGLKDDVHPSDVALRWGGLVDDLRRRLGPGTSLDPLTRATFAGRLGGDLSGVMIHRTPTAAHLAQRLGAEALSIGSHILGDETRLEASTPAGAALLGHELTHVVQRDADEHAAQSVEQAIALDGAGGLAGARDIDFDVLAERVYQRLLDELRLERERAAWID